MAAGAAESAEQGHSRYEEGCARIKDEEKSSLTISNFYATSDLFLHIPRRPKPVLHFSVGAPRCRIATTARFSVPRYALAWK
jgi:hypothetical protein